MENTFKFISSKICETIDYNTKRSKSAYEFKNQYIMNFLLSKQM